eukprot:scaffold60268_cov27-Tisochrysis_lutea.AAC.14
MSQQITYNSQGVSEASRNSRDGAEARCCRSFPGVPARPKVGEVTPSAPRLRAEHLARSEFQSPSLPICTLPVREASKSAPKFGLDARWHEARRPSPPKPPVMTAD